MKVFFMFCLFIQFFQSCKHVYLVSVDEALSLLNQISSPKLQCTLKICINEQKCYFMSMLDILINIVVAEVCTQPETLIQSLSTQPQADVVKWRFISKSCSIFRTAEVIGDLSLNEKKQQESQHQIFSKPRQACPMSMGAPRSQMDLQRPYLHPFQSGIPHFSCQGKSLSAPHLESSTVRGVNNVFSNPFGVLGPPENWLKFMKTVEVFFSCFFFFFLHFETSPQLFQSFRRMQWHCFAVKLQKCFVDYKTALDFSSAWGWEDNNKDKVYISTHYAAKCHNQLYNCILLLLDYHSWCINM